MTKQDLKIVFMGTPEFAVESLRTLVEGRYNVVAVVTMPDKPIGRHQTQLSQSPVKTYAIEKGIRVLQPEKLKSVEFIDALRTLNADLQIVVAFRMLPEIVWDMPRLGTFNLHAALLPQYRGAAPINWAIINGETETGVTTFFLDHDIDTGRIIRREPVSILDTDNAETVYQKLMIKGSRLVIDTVDDIIAGTICPIPQSQLISDRPLHHAPKIFKETCRIDWTNGVKRTYDFVRGLSPHPAAWTELVDESGKRFLLKIYTAAKEFCSTDAMSGTIISDGKTFFKVTLSDGYLHLIEVQIAGKKRMGIGDFLRGLKSACSWHVE